MQRTSSSSPTLPPPNPSSIFCVEFGPPQSADVGKNIQGNLLSHFNHAQTYGRHQVSQVSSLISPIHTPPRRLCKVTDVERGTVSGRWKHVEKNHTDVNVMTYRQDFFGSAAAWFSVNKQRHNKGEPSLLRFWGVSV